MSLNRIVGASILILLALMIVPAILSWAYPSIEGVTFFDWRWYTQLGPAFWLLLLLGLGVMALVLSGRVRAVFGIAAILLFLTLIYIGIGDGLNSGLRYSMRCVNAECSYDADDYPVYNGGVMRLKSGGRRTAWISGKVRVPNPICHDVNADPEVRMTWDAGAENVFIEPMLGLSEQLTTVTVQKSKDGACEWYWAERGVFF